LVKKRIIFVVLALSFALPAWAHDLYIKLDSYFVPAHARIGLVLINGTFDKSEGSVVKARARRIDIVRAGRGQITRDLTWLAKGDTTRVTIQTGAPGTYVVGISLLPKQITLKAKEFNAYLEEDGIPDILELRRARAEMDKNAREQYSKHVKAIIQVGDSISRGWDTRLGYPAEIVPLANPYTLLVGDSLPIIALVDRKPAAGLTVVAGFEPPGGKPEQSAAVMTDSTGRAAIRLTSTGKWYVKFIRMVPAASPGIDYESKWATLTFELR
jgi:hypothetical protein